MTNIKQYRRQMADYAKDAMFMRQALKSEIRIAGAREIAKNTHGTFVAPKARKLSNRQRRAIKLAASA